VRFSCALPSALDSPAHAALAEDLGYEHAWFYDNPPLSPDVWMMLGLAAGATSRMGLGPAVLNPGLRHPLVNAAGAAGLAALAPRRVAVAFGTGFGMRVVGQREVSWSYLEAYVNAFRGLLRGDTVLWEGAKMRMLHPKGHAPDRPIDVPVVISAIGPKGDAVARRLGDGLFVIGPLPPFVKDHEKVAALVPGTVLQADEDLGSERVRAAVGPGTMAAYHFAYHFGLPLSHLPGGDAFAAVLDRHPEDERHLAASEQHLIGLSAADEAAWDAGAGSMVEPMSVTGSPARVKARVGELAEQGVTEFVYQPAGPDIPRELETFMAAVD
jgi:5,10-methylenetetrahydromethanopterin reductase